jgi:hypothetical protein
MPHLQFQINRNIPDATKVALAPLTMVSDSVDISIESDTIVPYRCSLRTMLSEEQGLIKN